MTVEEIRRTGIHPEPQHDRDKMIAVQARGFREIKNAVAAFEAGALSAAGLLIRVKNIAHLAGEAGA